MQGRRSHEGTILEGLDPRHRTYYWIEEGRDQWVSDEMSDIFADPLRPHLGEPAPDRHHEPPRGRRAARVGARDAAGQRPLSARDLAARRPRGIKPASYPTGAWLSLARALGSGPRGRRFESSRPDQIRFNNLSAVLRALRGPSFFPAFRGEAGGNRRQLPNGEVCTAPPSPAADAGFTDQSHLTRVFRQVTGHPPGTVRQLLQAPRRSPTNAPSGPPAAAR